MSVYVCQLPQEIQEEIINKCLKVFESLAFSVNIEEEVENVLCSKLSDISDTINIKPYSNRRYYARKQNVSFYLIGTTFTTNHSTDMNYRTMKRESNVSAEQWKSV